MTVTMNVTHAFKSNHNSNYWNLCLQREIDFLVPFNKKKLPRKLRENVGASFLPGILATYWCLLYNDVLISPHQIDTKYRDSSQRIPPQQRFRIKSWFLKILIVQRMINDSCENIYPLNQHNFQSLNFLCQELKLKSFEKLTVNWISWQTPSILITSVSCSTARSPVKHPQINKALSSEKAPVFIYTPINHQASPTSQDLTRSLPTKWYFFFRNHTRTPPGSKVLISQQVPWPLTSTALSLLRFFVVLKNLSITKFSPPEVAPEIHVWRKLEFHSFN